VQPGGGVHSDGGAAGSSGQAGECVCVCVHVYGVGVSA